MSAKTIQDMASSIKKSLINNGFPEKAVSLPLERLYEAAHRDGLNFNKVLEELTLDGVIHEKTAEKIIFRPKPVDQSSPLAGLNFDSLKNMNFSDMNMGDMMKQVSELTKNLSPSQMLEIKKMYDNMSPEERSKLMDMAKSMKK